MTRLLTTVAVSALVLGFGAPALLAADVNATGTSPTQPQAQTSPSSTGQPQASPSATNQTQSQTQTGQPQAGKTASSDMSTKKQPMHHRTAEHASRNDSADHSADELNRQELSQITGRGAPSSYGGSR